MTDTVVRTQKHVRNFTTYHAESLSIMFAEWHLLFPAQKQDMNCTSCRAAVFKFWETMVDEWIEVESTPKKQLKKLMAQKNKSKGKIKLM